jgi:iron complex transport system ATP-binding protein
VGPDQQPIIAARGLRYGFYPPDLFLGPINFSVQPGALCSVVGPNGAGKSTLLRLLAGLIAPTEGGVELAGRSVCQMKLGDRARLLGYLPQKPIHSPSASAAEVVRLGRHPYRGFRVFESAEDLAIVRDSMEQTDTLKFARRNMDTLSGGETQRVYLAAALAQQPSVLLLDEPTSDLDLYHQWHIFGLLRELVVQRGLAVIVVSHELNLAARHSDTVLLLDGGSQVAYGPADAVLVPKTLDRVYRVQFEALIGGQGSSWLVPATIGGGPTPCNTIPQTR